jgi:C-3',4' desaturase CrtD
MSRHEPIVVIGAGIGGLTTAALLAQAGLDVTVLEAHVYPGGCAGTFFHKGYRFEAGATLAGGFYPGGPMDIVARAVGIGQWPAHPSDPAMTVHLPDGQAVTRFGDDRRWDEQARAFGAPANAFFRWQEQTADALWDLALRAPSWPPQTPGDVGALVGDGLRWLAGDLPARIHPRLLADAFRPVAAHLHDAPRALRLFIDAQLLIAAQTTSAHANALYGASALDLPRRGVVHLIGGIGAIAETLAEAVRRHGGKVRYRQEVSRIVYENGQPVAVETKRGETFPARTVIANLPPWNIAKLTGEETPASLRKLPAAPTPGWGAFMVYVGLDARAVPADAPLHHQVIVREPLGEGNSVFLSLSPAWDSGRAPAGQRALTISTHTALAPWWRLFHNDPNHYTRRKEHYVERMMRAAERVLPGLRAAANLVMPGTPVTFQRFTRRGQGWVGGFPQTSIFQAWGPRLDAGLWMVGDSIFPGQSTAAVALGGMRVARAILAEADVRRDASLVIHHSSNVTSRQLRATPDV